MRHRGQSGQAPPPSPDLQVGRLAHSQPPIMEAPVSTSGPGVFNTMNVAHEGQYRRTEGVLLISARVTVGLEVGSCDRREQLPSTAPALLLEQGVCTQSDWDRWAVSFSQLQEARCSTS